MKILASLTAGPSTGKERGKAKAKRKGKMAEKKVASESFWESNDLHLGSVV